MYKYFITGGLGFIGTNLTKFLSQKSEVIVFDNKSRNRDYSNLDFNDNVRVIYGDISNKELMLNSAQDCNVLIHLAYINGTKFFYEKPDEVLDVALNGINSVLYISSKIKFDKLIFASTSEVYNEPKFLPTTEAEEIKIPDILNPRFSYAGGKIFGELVFINKFRNKNKGFLKIFRPHNIFGPNMGYEHVIPNLTEKIKKNLIQNNEEVTINIQGSGNEVRSFCYIDDAINQIDLIIKDNSDQILYNVGNENTYSIIELLKLYEEIFNKKINFLTSENKINSPTKRYPDISKLKKLGFKSSSNFFEDLKDTVNWYKNKF